MSIATLSFTLSGPAFAGMEAFGPGPIIENYGKIAKIDTSDPLSNRARFKVSFDMTKPAEVGEINRKIDSLARFINMHADAGLSPKRIDLALVVHSKAVYDLTTAERYGAVYDGADNANAELIARLSELGVKFYICGQSAAFYDVEISDLLPGVNMSLSAMTAHAQLQQDGFTLNPF